jgi:ubiquitin C-terminal hydrolase
MCDCNKKPKPKVETSNFITCVKEFTAMSLWENHRVGEECVDCGTKWRHYYILSKISNILVILLEKFNGKKLIDFGESLLFEDEDGNKVTYKLKAQIEHVGSMGSGHYYCVCKRGNDWYLVDDSNVSLCQQSPTNNSYLLFYELSGM